MKRILSLVFGFFLLLNASQAQELSIEKQLVGIVGAVSGTVKTETRELKPGDKIYVEFEDYSLPEDVEGKIGGPFTKGDHKKVIDVATVTK